MRLGIMQPYFFPYIGYFQLMRAADRWIAFDRVQFIDKGWINRNRVLHPEREKEWQYITVPLAKRGQFDRICDISIKSEIDWRTQILGKLTAYKNKAPYYRETVKFLQYCFDTNATDLASVVISILEKTAIHLGIETPIEAQSKMNLSLGEINHPGQWALRISEVLKADEYINPLNGRSIFRKEEFEAANIELSFLEPVLPSYARSNEPFVSGLSIIDVLMFNDLATCRNMINQYSLKKETFQVGEDTSRPDA